MTATTVFYSWQSDLPNRTNRGLIEVALEKAAKAIRDDGSIAVEPVVDRDTAGMPGAPDISSTIFTKIDAASVFVCDVSIVGRYGARATPNPNVLIEVGWAKKSLGTDHVIMVMNTAYGDPPELPFDLRGRRVITYSIPDDDEPKAVERAALAKRLEEALRAVLGVVVTEPRAWSAEPVLEALRNGRPNRTGLTRRFLRAVGEEIDARAPGLTGDTADQAMVNALSELVPVSQEFATLANEVAANADRDVAVAMYDGLGPVLEGYYLAPEERGPFTYAQFGLHRFLGHEFLVTLVASLLREHRWEAIAAVLTTSIYLRNPRGAGSPAVVGFEYVSQSVELLDEVRNARLKLHRTSVRADMLRDRHQAGGTLANVVPFTDFIDADYFLFLRSVLPPEEMLPAAPWRAWSTLFMRQAPRFLVEATALARADLLALPLGVAGVHLLRQRIKARQHLLGDLWNGRTDWFGGPTFDADQIGTR